MPELLRDQKKLIERDEPSFIPLQGGLFDFMAQETAEGSNELPQLTFAPGHRQAPYEESRAKTRQVKIATSRHLARTSAGVTLSAIERTSQRITRMSMKSTTIRIRPNDITKC